MRQRATTRATYVAASATESELMAKYFRGLGDATRVQILELLAEHDELSVGELVARLRMSQSKVSNHLACLRWCGFVATRRSHPNVFYRIADGRVEELLGLAHGLLSSNADHVSACAHIDGSSG